MALLQVRTQLEPGIERQREPTLLAFLPNAQASLLLVHIRKTQPTHLTAGPDGNLWITETSKNKIGRLTRFGNITEYPIPSAPSVSTSYPLLPMPPSSQPTLITGGSDGNIWFLETNGDKLGRITPQGHITEFPLKEHLADVRGMSFASDGNLWLTDVNQLIRVTPSSGIESTYQIAPDSYLEGITSGPNGNLWFADGGAGKIGRLQFLRQSR